MTVCDQSTRTIHSIVDCQRFYFSTTYNSISWATEHYNIAWFYSLLHRTRSGLACLHKTAVFTGILYTHSLFLTVWMHPDFNVSFVWLSERFFFLVDYLVNKFSLWMYAVTYVWMYVCMYVHLFIYLCMYALLFLHRWNFKNKPEEYACLNSSKTTSNKFQTKSRKLSWTIYACLFIFLWDLFKLFFT